MGGTETAMANGQLRLPPEYGVELAEPSLSAERAVQLARALPPPRYRRHIDGEWDRWESAKVVPWFEARAQRVHRVASLYSLAVVSERDSDARTALLLRALWQVGTLWVELGEDLGRATAKYPWPPWHECHASPARCEARHIASWRSEIGHLVAGYFVACRRQSTALQYWDVISEACERYLAAQYRAEFVALDELVPVPTSPDVRATLRVAPQPLPHPATR